MLECCEHNEIECPECLQAGRTKLIRGRQRTPDLQVTSSNYVGGADLAHCPLCGSAFLISFEVSEVTREQDRDIDLEEEIAIGKRQHKRFITELTENLASSINNFERLYKEKP